MPRPSATAGVGFERSLKSMKRFPWLSSRKKTDPELPYEPPIWFGNHSNGEYFHYATRRDRKIRRAILDTAAENARKVGMDRRDFLASAMGMATSLLVLNSVTGCGEDEKPQGRANFCVPKEAALDPELANFTMSGNEFIFDIQTHWFKSSDLDKFAIYRQSF